MKIYLGELVKAFCRKTTVGIFIVLSLLNGVLFWINDNKKIDSYTPKEYKTAFEDIEGLSAKKAYEKISRQLQQIELINRLSYGEDISDELEENSEVDVEKLMEEYKENKGSSYLKYTDSISSEYDLLTDVLEEVRSCAEYDNYLENIDLTAKKMTGISLFADPNSFSYKNIEKTPHDFAHLKGSELKVGSSKGVSSATDFLATDLIAILMIMTVVVTIVTREKELNQISLSRTTFKGRTQLGIFKLLTCFFTALTAEIILYAVNFTVSYFTYGFGDLSRQIQSVIDFNSGALKISVLEYFVLFLLSKLAVYCVFAGFIYFATVVSDTAVKVYGILTVTLSAEAVLYYTIPADSYLCLFKYVNIFAYANTKQLFSNYLNLNLFGKPVNYIHVFVISVAVLLVAFSVLSVVIFSKQRPIKNRTKKLSFVVFKGRTTNLFFQECYKIFIGGKVLPVLLAFAIFTIVSYTPMTESFSSADAIYYKQYMEKLEGKYTDEKQKFIDDEQQKFDDAQAEMTKKLAETNDDSGDRLFVMMKYQETIAPQNAFEMVKKHSTYLKSTKNGEFIYDSGYKLLTGDKTAGNKDLTLALMAVAITILCLTYVYANEYQTGANVLLKTSAKGRSSTFLNKFLIGIVIVTVIYALTYFPYFYNVLNTYGIKGINAPLCSLENFPNSNISIRTYLILISIVRYIALIVAMLVIYLLSRLSKSIISTFLLSTAVLILPILLSMLGIKLFDYVLLNPFLICNL